MLRSATDASGVVIDGVTLGIPAEDPETGELIWDHPGLVEGEIVPNEWSEFGA